jgi:serine/threonine protein kinase
MELSPGATVGRLRLIECIAEGGTSAVWSAHHLTRGHDVAVKFLSASIVASDPAFRQRLEREVAIGKRIESEHVVAIHEHAITDDGTPYIVMELLEGIDLARAVVAAGPLTLHEASAVVAQTASVLEQAHALEIVHRDIKPDNVFLVEGPTLTVKVLDFGIAKFGLEGTGGPSRPSTMTRGGVVIGSPDFMSPEQSVSSRDVDFRSDLFSLGAVAYYALTGELPFAGDDKAARWRQIEAGTTPVRRWRDDLPHELDGWFKHAMALLPEQRFPSAKAMADALHAILAPLIPDAPATTHRISVESGAFRRPLPAPATHGMHLATELVDAGRRIPSGDAAHLTPSEDVAPESGGTTVPSHVVEGFEAPGAPVALAVADDRIVLTTVKPNERPASASVPGASVAAGPSVARPRGRTAMVADDGVPLVLWCALALGTAGAMGLLFLR